MDGFKAEFVNHRQYELRKMTPPAGWDSIATIQVPTSYKPLNIL